MGDPKTTKPLMNPGILNVLAMTSMALLDIGMDASPSFMTLAPRMAAARGLTVFSPKTLTPLRKVLGMEDPGRPANHLATMEMVLQRSWLALFALSKKSLRESALEPHPVRRRLWPLVMRGHLSPPSLDHLCSGGGGAFQCSGCVRERERAKTHTHLSKM